mgnify:CR=1 FL=1
MSSIDETAKSTPPFKMLLGVVIATGIFEGSSCLSLEISKSFLGEFGFATETSLCLMFSLT